MNKKNNKQIFIRICHLMNIFRMASRIFLVTGFIYTEAMTDLAAATIVKMIMYAGQHRLMICLTGILKVRFIIENSIHIGRRECFFLHLML